MATGVAPPIVLDGPLPRPPLYGLASVAQEAPADEHWRAGGFIDAYPPALPSAIDPCAEGTLRIKDTPEERDLANPFPAFTAYLGDLCSAMGIGSWDAFRARANIALAARENFALERQLVNAEYVQTTDGGALAVPHLSDGNDVLVGGSAVAARTAVAFLEGAIAETGQQGILHLTPEVVTYLGYEAFQVVAGTLRSASGTAVIVGQGYSDAEEPDGESAAGDGRSWVYASGPVMYGRSPEIFNLPESFAAAHDREDNTVIYRAERDLWVGWDGAFKAAILADWSP